MDLIPLPTNETYGQWRTQMYANALSISANSEKKDAAFEYIKWTLENLRYPDKFCFTAG